MPPPPLPPPPPGAARRPSAQACSVCTGCGQASPGKLSLGSAAKLPLEQPRRRGGAGERGVRRGDRQLLRAVCHSPRSGDASSRSNPSLPNYLALTSGSTQGIDSDCTDCSVSATNIVDQLEGARDRGRRTWRRAVGTVPWLAKHSPFAYCRPRPKRCPAAALRGWPATCARGGCRRTRGSRRTCATTATTAASARTAPNVPALLRERAPRGFLVGTGPRPRLPPGRDIVAGPGPVGCAPGSGDRPGRGPRPSSWACSR